jgi:hypothetical protein
MTLAGRPSRDLLYQRLDHDIGELWTTWGGLPRPSQAKALWKTIWINEAHHSTALEGNTLVLRNVQILLAEGRAEGNKKLSEYLEVQGYADAAEWVYEQAISPDVWDRKELIGLTAIRRIHELVMTSVWQVDPHPESGPGEGPGSFRQHDIHAFPAGMVPPSHVLVPSLMRDWVDAANRLRPRSAKFAEELAELHCRFEQVHPFLDGNGRTGRLVLNLLLIRLGYPPAIIYSRNRESYLAALRHGDGRNFGPLGEFLARAILDNLYTFIVPTSADETDLVLLAVLADESLSAAALRTAANRGRLQATRGADGRWRSSRAWVQAYRDTRQPHPS